MQQQDWTFVSSQHEAILAALDQRDGPLLSRLLVEHLSGAWRAIATLEAGIPQDQATPARALA
jgi:DNA-binding GntR family transcriptional regulator